MTQSSYKLRISVQVGETVPTDREMDWDSLSPDAKGHFERMAYLTMEEVKRDWKLYSEVKAKIEIIDCDDTQQFELKYER